MYTICRICANQNANEFYKVRERQMNKGDAFNYLYCPKCGTLQLADEIDPGPYYTDGYYSFFLKPAKDLGWLKRRVARLITHEIFIPEFLMYFLRKTLGFSTMILWSTRINYDSVIVDVGGGNGAFASELNNLGYKYVECIDKYCTSSEYENIKFTQGELSDIKGSEIYDLIMFNHSFEHIDNGIEVLENVKRLLKPNGICLIRIPVCENWVWNKYKADWRYIDAPRHYYLYTPRSMELLCNKVGLKIHKTRWDSYAGQMQIAENFYRSDRGLDSIEIKNDTIVEKLAFWHKTDEINKKRIGDAACFYITKE